MTEFEFQLSDRITKIQTIYNNYDLENKSYVSFSGGKDSTVLHHLVDLAVPGNKIPRVYFNTGIEYKLVSDFVKKLAEKDNRITIINSGVNIKQMLNEVGYPFKSKEHSLYLSVYQHSGMTKSVIKYLNREDSKFACPKRLRYQFTEDFKLKVSNKCCFKLKKEVGQRYCEENNKSITITGMRASEGGLRAGIKGCTIFADDECKELKKFHPLIVVDDSFMKTFIEKYDVELSPIYIYAALQS